MTALSILMPVVFGVFPFRSESFISEMICLYIVMCILLLGVSSRVLFYPQIKVKAKLTNSELGDRGGLYMWAGCMEILKCCDVGYVVNLSLDDT